MRIKADGVTQTVGNGTICFLSRLSKLFDKVKAFQLVVEFSDVLLCSLNMEE
jgi:hypothetical protein